MSVFQALSVGVSALQAQSSALSVISDNISNASTVGYKSADANFADLIASDTPVDYSPGGVVGTNRELNGAQGEITGTNSSTDLAIAGNGFFAVSSTSPAAGDIVYTRAGSFTPNANGDFANTAGFFLQGWRLDSNGNLPAGLSVANLSSTTAIAALQTVNVSALTETPTPTTTVSLIANLNATQAAYAGAPAYNAADPLANMASGAIAPDFNRPITVIDSTGATHSLVMGFLKTGANTWATEIYAQPAADVTGTAGQVAAGTITFNGDGTLASVSPALSSVTVNWTNGAAASQIAFNLGTAGQVFGTPGAVVIGRSDGLSQFSSGYNVTSVQTDGSQASTLAGVTVSANGVVTGDYANGTTRNLYQIPLATFLDPGQLQSLTGNVFQPTVDASTPNFQQAAQGGTGKILDDSLESSNVDTSLQLVNMIVAQRAYQANSKTISTSDTMLQDLTQMVV